jgi:hypothetical protein
VSRVSGLKAPCIVKPKALTDKQKTDDLEVALWKEEVGAYSKRTGVVKPNMKAIFAVIWGQCNESLKDKLRSINRYEIKYEQGDCVWLLTEIKGIMLSFEGQRY